MHSKMEMAYTVIQEYTQEYFQLKIGKQYSYAKECIGLA